MKGLVDQNSATAHGDIVGGNKLTIVNHQAQLGFVGVLIKKLQTEVEKKVEIQHVIEKLQQFQQYKSVSDGVIGLEAKLDKAGRSHEKDIALETKEAFAKLLERWSLYPSAQEIFAHLLGRAVHEFTYSISPKIGSLDESGINQLITDRVVTPTISECGTETVDFSHAAAMGMIYWLAERCFVRWHK
ncbi:hypothetical protein NKK48_09165 [Mesorhizobium sp. C386A]|uniref:ABC-three component system protein n=1 Tax=unclassified Mesorhizobium TaxID=325217 RepID=UPI0003CE85FA|nr:MULTISPECIES: ABC-three component system protein [unclassified Mesorhizobium]ESY03936.1 hypothetical protein X752_27845 [Mesorhizobium sp. LNJC398B00]ESY38636.1 hypothetical protein X748_04060 [Mesorhizobium sp. LNJC386A00]